MKPIRTRNVQYLRELIAASQRCDLEIISVGYDFDKDWNLIAVVELESCTSASSFSYLFGEDIVPAKESFAVAS